MNVYMDYDMDRGIAVKVLNYGSLNLDYVYHVDHFVQPGETLSARSQTVTPGGKGLNQSIALAKAGAEVYHAGCFGIGGDNLVDLLNNSGVDTTFLQSTDEIQGNTVIQVVPSGENNILLFGGSNQCVTPQQINHTFSVFSEGDYLVLQNEINNLPLIVDKAYEQGMRIVLNPSPYNECLDAVDFSKISWLLMNEVETFQISKCSQPEEAWNMLHETYPKLSVLITMGSKGSVAYRVLDSKVETARQEVFPVRAVDTTAAGDTYTGFFIGGLLQGRPLQECMKRASMAAALGVTRPGAAASIPTQAEVEGALWQK